MELKSKAYLEHHYPQINKLPNFIQKIIFGGVKRLLHENEVNSFMKENQNKDAFAFIESILDYFQISISLYTNQLENIPSYGRVIIIANHPLGALDALSLISTIKNIRRDVKIIGNSFLYNVENLKDIIIPIDNINGKMTKDSVNKIYESLEREEAIIMFPSGEVSRIKPTGVKDTPWQSGFYKIASRTRSPLLPIYINAKNSNLFYLTSMINKSLATALLPHEMFKYKRKKITFTIGKIIPPESYQIKSKSKKEIVQLLRKHFYKIAKNKQGIFLTENPISPPEDKIELKKELENGQILGKTKDGKEIILYENNLENCVIREIGRLREVSFRQVGEGSGNKRDIDKYDFYYKHLIIWDLQELEIAGAYRLGVGKDILQTFGIDGLYTSTLFEFDNDFKKYIENGIELGRSFVQPSYWNSRALDYLWQGIGAYLSNHSDIRYLFGAVSLSDNFNSKAKALMVYFYSHYFGAKKQMIRHKMPYYYPVGMEKHCKEIFDGKDYKKDFRILRSELQKMGYSVPTLYKQYSDIYEENGVEYHDFGYDTDFNNCIDGFIVADTHMLKPSKKERYIKNQTA